MFPGTETGVRKILLVSVKFVSAILGPEMAVPILWTPGKMLPFCRKKTMSIKFLVLWGGYFGFWGGGECRFYFYGREDFSDGGYIRMFPGNEDRNEGRFACSLGTKTGTRAHLPKPPFSTKPPFCLPLIFLCFRMSCARLCSLALS